mmetsp:Transcript_7458/g.16344  ORF Transcript_7458/g.16344 Transcript_7458/m.16344 type:complete len:261 (+) Transcript_7458:172-954(+)
MARVAACTIRFLISAAVSVPFVFSSRHRSRPHFLTRARTSVQLCNQLTSRAFSRKDLVRRLQYSAARATLSLSPERGQRAVHQMRVRKLDDSHSGACRRRCALIATSWRLERRRAHSLGMRQWQRRRPRSYRRRATRAQRGSRRGLSPTGARACPSRCRVPDGRQGPRRSRGRQAPSWTTPPIWCSWPSLAERHTRHTYQRGTKGLPQTQKFRHHRHRQGTAPGQRGGSMVEIVPSATGCLAQRHTSSPEASATVESHAV